MTESVEPRGHLQIRTVPRPADLNALGKIFGGWVMAQMDIAGGIAGAEYIGGPCVTVAVDSMHFVQPIELGDIVCIYTDIERVGRTSVTVHVETWVLRRLSGERFNVTEADFVFVAVDGNGRPTPIEKPESESK